MVLVFINLGSKVNVIHLDFAKKLGIQACKTKVGTRKINCLKLDGFDIIIAFFSIKDKKRISHCFDKTFLFADISIHIILRKFFLIVNYIEIYIVGCHFY